MSRAPIYATLLLLLSGLPVLAAPVVRPGRMPVGVQLIAPPWREDRLFAIAARLEAEGVIGAALPSALAVNRELQPHVD